MNESDWPNKNEREEYEIYNFIEHYKKLPQRIEKREKPDYFAKIQNRDVCFGVELTSVYLSDRSVPDEHIPTLNLAKLIII
jgi:hypothetical protein